MRKSVVRVLQAASAQGLSVAGNQAGTVLSGGNVGIGTTNPATLAEVYGNSTDGSSIGFQVKNTNAASYGAGALVRNDTDNYINVNVQGSTRTGTLSGFNRANLAGVVSNGDAMLVGTQASSPLAFITNSNTNMVISQNGNVGIGTMNPTEVLYVSGNIYATGTLSGGSNAAWTLNGSNAYYDNGNVGIGTTNPGAALDIVGDIIQDQYSRTIVTQVASATNPRDLTTLSIPAESGAWLVEVTCISGRQPNGDGGTSTIAKESFVILRIDGSTDIVIDSSITNGAFDEQTSSAGGSNNAAAALGLTCVRTGSEAATAAQEVAIQGNIAIVGGSTGTATTITRITGTNVRDL